MSEKLTRLVGHLKAKGMSDEEATKVAVRHLQNSRPQNPTAGMHLMKDYVEKAMAPQGHAVKVTKLRRTRVKR